MKLKTIVFILLSLPSYLWGATYYIDQTGGLDTNNGICECSAWKTISKVNTSSFLPGDSVLLKKGELWREQLTVSSSGASGNPITFSSYGTGTNPLIDGANIVSGWVADAQANTWNSTVSIQPKVVLLGGVAGIKVAAKSSIVALNQWFWAGNVLSVYSATDPTNTVESGANSYNITASNKDFITITGLSLQAANVASIYLQTSTDNWVIQNCDISNTLAGIQSSTDVGSNNTIQNNSIHDTVEFGIVLAGTNPVNTLVQGNTIYNIGRRGGTFTNMTGIYGHFGTGSIIQNNLIHDGGDTGADHGIYTAAAVGLEIRYNTIYNFKGFGVKVSYGGNHVNVYYNLLTSNGSGIITDQGSPAFVNIHNNVMANTIPGGNATGLRASTGDHVTWKNNVIYNINYPSFSANSQYNLFLDPSVTNFASDNNLVFSDTPNASGYYAFFGGVGRTWAQWQAAGRDLHGLNVDPLFINKLTDFRLQTVSPAINAGTNVGLIRDFIGNVVPSMSAPDMGAYEWFCGQ